MSIESLKKLIEQYPKDGTVYLINHEGEAFWLKTEGEEKRNLLRVFSVFLSQFTPFSFLKVNSILSSKERIKLEVNNIQLMKKVNMPVPDIVLTGADYFVTRDSGMMLTQLKLSKKETLKTLMQTYTLLAHFHRNGFYHGRPALRDIIVSDEGVITFIDFEESGVIESPQLMARDVFLLLMDSGRLERLSHQDKLDCLKEWANEVPDELVRELLLIYKKAKALTFLAHLVLKFKKNKTSLYFLGGINVLNSLFESQQ